MNRRTLAASFALAVLGGLGLVASAVAQDELPFRGRIEGFTDVSNFPSAVLNATGTGTQLGQFTFSEPHVVTPPTGSGTFEFVAANGDTLFGTATGLATPTAVPNVLTIVENAIITGGTGRFAGATGGYTLERVYDRVSGETSGSFEGTISAPGSGN